MNLAFKITAAATPLGSTLLTLTKDDLEAGSGFRVELTGLGAGRIVINRNRPEATAANFAQDNYVRVYDLDLSSLIPLGGFFLDDTQIQVLSLDEEGGEIVQFGGPGALSYFGRCALWNINYVNYGDDLHYGPRADGNWYWYNDQYGDILKRMIDEGQDADRPPEGHGIDDLTYDFTSSVDSAGAAWDSFTGTYSLPTGTNYLDIAQRFRDVGLTIQVSGDLLMQAYQGFYGVDRTSAIFAADKVRFVNVDGAAGANIVEELARQSHPSLQLSRVLVQGDSGEPSTMVTRDAASYNVAREGFAQYPSSHAPETLQAVGDQALQIRSDSSDVPSFRHLPGLNALSGRYSPFPTGVPGTNLLLGVVSASIKVSGEDPGAPRTAANDGNDATPWSEATSDPPIGVAGAYWAADLGVSQEAASYRIDQLIGGAPTIQNMATEVRLYGSNDAGAWSWLPSGKMSGDPAANGWTLVATHIGPLTFYDTGQVPFTAASYRYWLFRAVAGGTADWDVDELELWDSSDPDATYWLGDLVTLHTGTETGDYTEVNLRVYAINWLLDEQGNWWPQPELGGLLQLAASSTPSPSVTSIPGAGGVVTVAGTASPPPALRKQLTNKSGGAVTHGDVVVIDPDNNEAFETTTTAAETRLVGIAQEDIASNATGWVLLAGYAELVTPTASVTRGHYGFTSTTAKKASGAAARTVGAFCQFLKGGTEPSAILFGPPDKGSGHTVKENGTLLTARSGLNFGSGIVATDDSGNDETDVDLDWAESGDLSTQAFGDTASAGTSEEVARGDHKHGMPANPFVEGASAKASGTADVTITGSLQDLTGATLSLAAGTYIVMGVFDVRVNNSGNDRLFEGHLDVNAADENDIAALQGLGLDDTDRQTIVQQWRVTLASTQTVKLRGKYSGGATGDFTVLGANTTLVAFRVGGLGAWTDYTPVLTATTTNPTLGSSSLIGRYKQIDSKTYTIQINLVVTTGGAWNAGSGNWELSLPAGLTTPNVANRNQSLACHIRDAGTTYFAAVARCIPNSTKVDLVLVADTGGTKQMSNANPVTWATGDEVNISGIIEVA